MSIEIHNLHKSFDKIQALNQIDLSVNDGEIFGLIGPDGAGKTTLFRIVVSLLIPDSGTCLVNGYNVVKDYREVRRSIGFMPGRFSLYMDLSVEENLNFYAGVFGTTVRENYNLIKDIYIQIEPFRKRLAGKLSGGMKQKLALSCALIHRPSVLVLDEPTTGVDAVSRREFWEMLKKIQGEGITILVSTPYMDEAELCDRVALIQKGVVLDVSDPVVPAREENNLFALRSEQGVYRYLEKIRRMEQCKTAWLFGDEIHVTLKESSDNSGIKSMIDSWNDPSLQWIPISASIEDRFMELIEVHSA